MSLSPTTLAGLATAIGAELRGGAGADVVRGVASLEEAGPDDVAFYTNPVYRRHLRASRAKAIIVSAGDAGLPELADRALLVAKTPYAAFARASTHFHPPLAPVAGVDARAVVERGAQVDAAARVEAYAVVKAGAKVGPGAVLMSFAYVGEGAVIGEGSVLWPHAVVREGCVVGARCLLHAGAVVGADGFGFAFDPDGDAGGPMHRKIPQAGIARLEDDVELGANSCVDRATLGETVVGRGTKLDNLVQVAHNVKIGPLCVIAAQTGIAGSSTVGAGVQMGGQSGVVGHLQVGDLARFGARTAAFQDVEAGATVMGTPAVDARAWRRSAVALTKLPELLREVRELRRRLASVEAAQQGASRAGGDSKAEEGR